MDIPKSIRAKYLPSPLDSVIDLLRFPTPNLNLNQKLTVSLDGVLSTQPSHFQGRDELEIDQAIVSLVIPPATVIQQLRAAIGTHKEYQSFQYLCNGTSTLLPFWILSLWMEQSNVASAQTIWIKAVQWTGRLERSEEWVRVLERIPWKYELPRMMGAGIGIQLLASYCSTSWLNSSHIDQMSAIVDHKLLKEGASRRFLGVTWSDTLRTIFQTRRHEYQSSPSSGFLCQLGAQCKAGSLRCIAAIIAVNLVGGQSALPNAAQPRANHWIGIVLDLDEGLLYHGDSASVGAPAELLDILRSWLAEHQWTKEIKYETLPCTPQQDGYSCSTLAFNAVLSYLYPSYSLVSPTLDGAPGRYQALDLISTHIQTLMGNVQGDEPREESEAQKGTAAQTIEGMGSSSTSEKANRFLKRWPGYTFDQQMVSIFQQVTPPLPSKRGPSKSANTRKSKRSKKLLSIDEKDVQEDIDIDSFDNDTELEDDLGEIGEQGMLVDCPVQTTKSAGSTQETAKRGRAKGPDKGGRPRSNVLDLLTIRCYRVSNPECQLWRCSGQGCTHTYHTRGIDRVFKHARICNRLAPNLQDQVRLQSAMRVAGEEEDGRDGQKGKEVEKGKGPRTGKISQGSQNFFDEAVKLGKADRHKQMTDAITELFCICGLPLALASSAPWKKVLQLADPSYKPPDRTALTDKYIPAHADRIYRKNIDILASQNDLTLSLDGGTSHGGESFWTLHVSTPLGQVYLILIREATADSHTGIWIKNLAMEAITAIGPARFSSNCVHHLSNTIGDIVKLDYFKQTLSIVRGVITKIHKSHLGSAEFRAARLNVPGAPGRGLEAVGKTRFGTIIYSARSVEHNLLVLKEVTKRGNFDFKPYTQYFQSKPSHATSKFEFALSQLVSIGTLAIQAMACLESNLATAADVYVFYHTFILSTLEALEDPGLSYPLELQTEIRSILEYCYNQLFGNGNLSSDVYISAAYLVPAHMTSTLFKADPVPEGNLDYAGIRNFSVFKRVVSYLGNIAGKETTDGHKPEFTKWKGRASVFKNKLLNELKAYSRHQYPFNLPYDEDLGPLLWWSSLCNNELAEVLPPLAMKIFSIRVNSMEEERTGSVFTWLSSPLRSQISVNTMGAITQVRRHSKQDSKPRPHSMKRPKLQFYDFSARFMDNETVKDNGQTDKTSLPEVTPAVVVHGDNIDSLTDSLGDDEYWLHKDPESSNRHFVVGATTIAASPVAVDSVHISTALSLDDSPTIIPDVFSLAEAQDDSSEGDDTDFSIHFSI